MILELADDILQDVVVAEMRSIVNSSPEVAIFAYFFGDGEGLLSILALNQLLKITELALRTAAVELHFFFYGMFRRQMRFPPPVCQLLAVFGCFKINLRHVTGRLIEYFWW